MSPWPSVIEAVAPVAAPPGLLRLIGTAITSTGSLESRGLAEKVAWEGGAFEALRYGVRSDEIADPELARMWHEMEEFYERIAPIASAIDRKLGRAA